MRELGVLHPIALTALTALLVTSGCAKSEDTSAPPPSGGCDASAADCGSPIVDSSAPPMDAAADGNEVVDASDDAAPDAGVADPLSNYDEPYRPQFHISAPHGWLNDANGMWFTNGVYHVAYQATPLSFASEDKDWGHVTSLDLIHWTNQPLMLRQGVNVPGSAWSGSTVVDVDNTSGFKNGSNPVLVTLYTATSKGTCVAYSNDLGVTWTPYVNNPVAIGGTNADTRDPHVFWHEASHQWVTALYENGITLYTSTNLRDWTKRSNVAFGFECPDMYELPIDGNAATTKWVLQDASGSYLLGTFDGTTFTPDNTNAIRMDASNGFYASQTFYRRTFPTDRVVQIAWVRAIDGVTAPWNQSLSIPAEIKLISTTEGVRVTRAPIAEVATLHGAHTAIATNVFSSGQNIATGLQSSTFDLEMTIDVRATTAHTLQFRIANLTFAYDFTAQTLFGAPLPDVGGKLKLRILVDHANLEIFGNDGRYSYTTGFAFTPGDGSIAITGDGFVSVVSGDFYTMNRAWAGAAAKSSAVTDDGSPAAVYAGDWSGCTEDRYFGHSCRIGRGQGETVEIDFNGTRVDWYGLKNTDLGLADVYVDGTVRGPSVDLYDSKRQNARLFTIGGLPSGPHKIRVVGLGTKNAASSGTALVHDYFISYQD